MINHLLFKIPSQYSITIINEPFSINESLYLTICGWESLYNKLASCKALVCSSFLRQPNEIFLEIQSSPEQISLTKQTSPI